MALQVTESQSSARGGRELCREDGTRIQGRWIRTGHIAEEIRKQKDRVPRRKVGKYPIPGYMGHIPDHNPQSATANDEKPCCKQKMLLFDLDQYSRGAWPHYKGFKTQVENNVKDPNQAPPGATTYEYYNDRLNRAQKILNQPPPKRAAHKSGVKSFFSEGSSEAVSANGLGMAESFFKYARPYEGSLWALQAEKALASRYL
ncbi:uncharacterized protein LOC112349979 [Selaginella moellendorffii]|uniref:uncharacterized protein LOC112349979 n=1 Tax=Selaginella moellendorffii TaxID=88036 RepID=UPI000D1CEEDD|nr:uncharacterized protein LOC112349979 [Selaginella moellendorffii]|eukprot:XP_024541101.1 uncharacterized protein LOC112349979 [Selaginella moellendorffii]